MLSRTYKYFWHLLWGISLVLSIVVRIPGLQSSSNWWRANQTELTAFWFDKEGIDLINYETPLYGPPWQIPFEFPLFQATAAIISKTGVGDIAFSCRLAALFYFYLAALFIYLLSKKIFQDEKVTFISITLFLWLPYNIYYSTEPLIDYAALSFSLAYFYYIFLWLKNPHKRFFIFLSTLAGCLAVLVKPTTVPVVVVPIVTFVLKDILQKFDIELKSLPNYRLLLNKIWFHKGYWLSLALIGLTPLILGYLWTRHADNIKSVSLFTQWLTSDSLKAWNFGSLALRKDQFVWLRFLNDGERWVMPYGLSAFIVFGFISAAGLLIGRKENESKDISLFYLSATFSILLTFGIFLNLYQHTYYFIAWTASISFLSGYGIVMCWELRGKIPLFLKFFLIAWTVFFVYFGYRDHTSLSTVQKSDTTKWLEKKAWAEQVQMHLPEDKWIVIVDYDWSPVYPYLLQRKSMVFSPKDDGKPICKLIRDDRFEFVILADPNYQGNLTRVLNCYDETIEVMPGVYQIVH